MIQRGLAAAVVVVIWASAASAQEPNWQFRWQKGQVLTYKAEHKTSVEEVVEKSKAASGSKLSVVKRWQVAEVDAKGTPSCTFRWRRCAMSKLGPMAKSCFSIPPTRTKAQPELREQMSKFIGQTLAILRVDTQGRVLEVKQGSAGSL